jgi:threonylcarbamoyladenosine tRNA methylthiotransferase MtaB
MASVDPQTQVGEIRKERRISRLGATVFPEHTRTFLKIQDGCDAFCSYCIIPHVRGKCRSLPREEVEERITVLVLNGYREVVLTGIHLGAWGCDLRPQTNLASLVQQIIQGRTVNRLRLSSVEPREVSGTLISLLGSPHTICRHLHIPLQSGNDGILEAMRRNYTAAFFCDLLRRMDQAVPGIAVGVDVMAGFPGETESAFSDTLHLIEESPIAYLHVFPYSRRPGTPAAAMSEQVPEEVKRRRAERLRAVGAE